MTTPPDTGLHFDAMMPAQPLRQAGELGRRAEVAGLSGLVVTEAGRTAYLTCGALATATTDIDILTGIAVAFPRSPMVTAATAWELAEATGGRFRLGLGAQVRAHILRGYGAEFDPPGPRLPRIRPRRQGHLPLVPHGRAFAVDGESTLSLLPPTWSPGPIECDDPPVDVAAVNPWMLRMAGEVADGVHVHPLNTPTYLDETVLPELGAGAARSGRAVEDLEVIVPAFVCVGDTEEVNGGAGRVQVAFYGSTPNYAFILGRTTAKARPSASGSANAPATSPAWRPSSTTTSS